MAWLSSNSFNVQYKVPWLYNHCLSLLFWRILRNIRTIIFLEKFKHSLVWRYVYHQGIHSSFLELSSRLNNVSYIPNPSNFFLQDNHIQTHVHLFCVTVICELKNVFRKWRILALRHWKVWSKLLHLIHLNYKQNCLFSP